jgi:hypothetical protein
MGQMWFAGFGMGMLCGIVLMMVLPSVADGLRNLSRKLGGR